MSRAVLSVGSNIGDRLGHLQSVCDQLAGRVVAVSPVYVTAPWGVADQDDFFNAVLVVDDPARGAYDWLSAARRAEERARRRRHARWGPRTLDVDVIAVTDVDESGQSSAILSDDPVLLLPHPRAAERAFVLIPWLDADSGAVLVTVDGMRRVADLVADLSPEDRLGVRRADAVLSVEPVAL